MIAYFLSVLASNHKLSKPYELDALGAPYFDRVKPVKTPEQRLKEFELQQRFRAATLAGAGTST